MIETEQRDAMIAREVELLYCARSRSDAAFVKQIEAFGLPVTCHFNDEHGDRGDLRHFLESRPADAHFYACGLASMLDDFERLCAELGRKHAHVERFVARDLSATQQSSYEVERRRSGRKLVVTPAKSLLQTLLDEGIEVALCCTQGLCGACKTRVLEGAPDHCDSVLTSAERASHAVMTVCVSGCKSGTLVLDL